MVYFMESLTDSWAIIPPILTPTICNWRFAVHLMLSKRSIASRAISDVEQRRTGGKREEQRVECSKIGVASGGPQRLISVIEDCIGNFCALTVPESFRLTLPDILGVTETNYPLQEESPVKISVRTYRAYLTGA